MTTNPLSVCPSSYQQSQCGAQSCVNPSMSPSRAGPAPRSGLSGTTVTGSSGIGSSAQFSKAVAKGQARDTKNLTPFLSGGTVTYSPGGKIIIDGVNLKFPDYDEEIKKEYQRGLEEIGKAACMQKAADKGFGYLTTVAIWVVIIILLVALVWYFFSSKSSTP